AIPGVEVADAAPDAPHTDVREEYTPLGFAARDGCIYVPISVILRMPFQDHLPRVLRGSEKHPLRSPTRVGLEVLCFVVDLRHPCHFSSRCSSSGHCCRGTPWRRTPARRTT